MAKKIFTYVNEALMHEVAALMFGSVQGFPRYTAYGASVLIATICVGQIMLIRPLPLRRIDSLVGNRGVFHYEISLNLARKAGSKSPTHYRSGLGFEDSGGLGVPDCFYVGM